MKIDALQKYQNQLLSAFNAEQLQYLKYDNWTGLLTETDRLYATMFHDWDVLQKDSSDLAEAVQSLEWTVAPYVADGKEADAKAQEVAKTVTDALWKRTNRQPGTYSHTFPQLLNALVHALFRGFNVHEIEWVNDGELVYPAAFHQLPPQFMRWEDRAGEVDRLLFVSDGETATPRPFPANKYIVALNTSGPDHPLYNAMYYSLIAWYGAYKFGLGWFMEYCQKYGMPKLVFHYESERDRQQLEKDLAEERVLNNILLKGDRTVDIANAPASGASLPQRELLNLAESQCHKLILGQTLTSDTSQHGGSLAQAKVHAGVHAEVVKKRAAFVADVLNSQLIPAIVLLNYGTLDVPMPELVFKLPQEGVTLERVQVLKTALEIKGMRIKKSEAYEFMGFAQPAEGDDVFEAASDGGDMAGLAGMLAKGKGKPQDDTDPDNDPPKPKKKVKPSTADDAEPVSAAKANAPTDPAQEWLAPIKQKFLEARKAGASMADLKQMLLTMHPNTKALAKAFANNILAGFAGESEEVDASNPYGCNQYGEGWRQPHNGRASKAGAPVKKTDPTEEERKAREGEAKKAKEKHPVGQATTREEAIEHTRSLLSPEFRETGEVEFDDSVTLEQINEINATLKELTDKYPVKTLRRIGTYVDESDTVGAQATSTKIEFNIDHENGGIKGLHNWRPYGYDKVQETGYTRHNVGATNNGISLRDLTTHEYGHVIQAKISHEYEWLQNKKAQGYDISKFDAQYEAMKKWRRVYGRAKTEKGYPPRSDIQRNLSKYAMKNDREFFSECFAARERGEKLPAYIEKGLDDMISFVNMNS